jgi:hypothetical protein
MLPVLALLLCAAPADAGTMTVILGGSPPFPTIEELVQDSVALTDSSLAALEEELMLWYLSEGYPFAGAGLYFSSRDTLRVNAVPGRHAALEEVRIEGAPGTGSSVFTRMLRMKPGEPYSRADVLEWRGRLERLPFVESVGSTGLLLGPYGDLVLVQEVVEGPSGLFSASMGWDGKGVEGGGEVAFTNLAGTARQLEVSGEATDWGGLNAGLRYREPWLFGVPLSAELEVSQDTPESSWVNREGSITFIWGADLLETSAGAGIWRGYPPDGSRETYDYGLAGIRYTPGRRVPQGWLGADISLEARVGDLSGEEMSSVLSIATLSSTGHWFRGVLGLGGEILAGGVMSGDWFEGLLTPLGGQETLRGYQVDAFTAVRYSVARPEFSLGETSTRAYLFADLAVLETPEGLTRYPAGCGAGIRGCSGIFLTEVSAGFPILDGPGSSRLYLQVSAGV